MTELDFDELDKAVNTLMGDVDTSKRIPGLDDPEDKVVTLTMSDSPVDATAPVVSAPVSDTNESAVTAAPVAPLAVKRRGQFMDVMHPSSDMKSPFAPVNRQGATLQPSSPTVQPEALAAVPEPDLEAVAIPALGMEMESTGTGVPPVSSQPTQPVVASEEPVKNEWPDPIDMAQPRNKTPDDTSVGEDQSDETAQLDTHQSVDTPDASDDASANEFVSSPEAESQSSPFIADAKVEKRPLGAPIAEQSEPQTPESTPEEPSDGPQDDVPPPVLLPEELKSDVMSLESSSTGAVTPEVSPAPPAAPADNDSASTPVSIQQQYTEQPNTGDQTNTPIFDTSTHNQPLESAKKKSPLKWVFAILTLLVIGAAVGAAYFYYTTQ